MKKLLKAIEDLEAKVKKGEVVKLEPEQQEKLGRKPEILKARHTSLHPAVHNREKWQELVHVQKMVIDCQPDSV